MQLIKVSPQLFFIFKKWGSTGSGAYGSLDVNTKEFTNKAAAIKFFDHHFKDKTGNKFEDVHNFKKRPGKYNFVVSTSYDDSQLFEVEFLKKYSYSLLIVAVGEQDQYEEEEDESDSNAGGAAAPSSDLRGPSMLPKQVQNLVRRIFDAKEVQRTMEVCIHRPYTYVHGHVRTVKQTDTALRTPARRIFVCKPMSSKSNITDVCMQLLTWALYAGYWNKLREAASRKAVQDCDQTSLQNTG
jgi:hypothetical protein